MDKPRIFVSYSARPDRDGKATDRQRAQRLVAELQADFAPWWDQDGLDVGSRWNDTISEQLATCHGAVVLLSPVSVNSDFVLHEAGYLSIRRRSEHDFPLCTFLCDGLTFEQLSPFLKAIQFSEFQFETWEEPGSFESLRKALAATRERVHVPLTPMAALESTLAGPRYFGTIPAAALRGAAHRLRWDEQSHWRPDAAVPRLFVRHLFGLAMRQQLKALYELGGELDDEQLNDAFDWIAPFWIDERAAAAFSRVAGAPPGRRGALINARYADFTPEMFARRSRPHLRWNPRSFSIQEHVPVGRNGGVIEQIRRSILDRLDLDEDAPADEIREALEWVSEDQTLCSVIVDADDEILREVMKLQKDFREVLFLLLCSERVVAVPDDLQNQCETIQPPLGAGDDPRYDENNALRAYNRCLELLGRSSGDHDHER